MQLSAEECGEDFLLFLEGPDHVAEEFVRLVLVVGHGEVTSMLVGNEYFEVLQRCLSSPPQGRTELMRSVSASSMNPNSSFASSISPRPSSPKLPLSSIVGCTKS